MAELVIPLFLYDTMGCEHSHHGASEVAIKAGVVRLSVQSGVLPAAVVMPRLLWKCEGGITIRSTGLVGSHGSGHLAVANVLAASTQTTGPTIGTD